MSYVCTKYSTVSPFPLPSLPLLLLALHAEILFIFRLTLQLVPSPSYFPIFVLTFYCRFQLLALVFADWRTHKRHEGVVVCDTTPTLEIIHWENQSLYLFNVNLAIWRVQDSIHRHFASQAAFRGGNHRGWVPALVKTLFLLPQTDISSFLGGSSMCGRNLLWLFSKKCLNSL